MTHYSILTNQHHHVVIVYQRPLIFAQVNRRHDTKMRELLDLIADPELTQAVRDGATLEIEAFDAEYMREFRYTNATPEAYPGKGN